MQANTVVLTGRLTADPELKVGKSGKPYLKFSIAVNRKQERDSEVDFFDCTTFGKSAERLGQYGRKGALVLIGGRLQQERWENSEGQKRSKVAVIADSVRLGQVPDGFEQMQGGNQPPTASSSSGYGGQSNDGGGYGRQGEPPASDQRARAGAAASGNDSLLDDSPF